MSTTSLVYFLGLVESFTELLPTPCHASFVARWYDK